MTKQVKLKPCPFCGGVVEEPFLMKSHDYRMHDTWVISCLCLSNPRLRFPSKEAAIKYWNKRAGGKDE